jgi:hypothetical protein
MSYNTIYSNNEMTEGLFGMVLLFIFEVLPILEMDNVDVSKLKWFINTTNYGAIFPKILEYNSEYIECDLNKLNNVTKLFNLRKEPIQYVLGDDFENLNKLFFKYFKIPQELENIANSYNLNDCLGLHFRGTDKTTDSIMNEPVTKDDFCKIADSYIISNNIKKIFLATDEPKLFDYFKNKYTDIHFLTSRNFKNNLFWKGNNDVFENAKEAMIDMLCLSKCDTVIKVSSALSAFSKLINPNLKIYRVNALKMFVDIPYFPDAYIPLLEKNTSYTGECNEILNKIQSNDWSYTHKNKFNNFFIKIR